MSATQCQVMVKEDVTSRRIIIRDFMFEGQRVVAKAPIEFPVVHDTMFLLAKKKSLGIDAFVLTSGENNLVEELKEEIVLQLQINWGMYVAPSRDFITNDADKLKRDLMTNYFVKR